MHGGDAARGNHTVVSPASGKGIKRHTFFFSARGFEHGHQPTITREDD
jgi:hypothetical protein